MKGNRLRPQEIVAGVAGLALLVSLFLPWATSVCGPDGGCGESETGWNALAVIDLVLALAAACGIALPVVAATNSKSDAPITGDAFVALAGIVSVVLVTVRLIDPAGGSSVGFGAFLALAASLAMAAGAWSAMADEGS